VGELLPANGMKLHIDTDSQADRSIARVTPQQTCMTAMKADPAS
jgi:hypothetical protein